MMMLTAGMRPPHCRNFESHGGWDTTSSTLGLCHIFIMMIVAALARPGGGQLGVDGAA
jgi:hypothetical protein